MKRGQKQTGFTIVELLVVIVVIAILAAIAVVAYSGIQDRARNSALLSGIDTIEKALNIYAVQNGQYPKPTELPSQISGWPAGIFSATCLQPTNGSWPAQDTLGSSECYTVNGATPAWAGYSDIVNDALASVTSSVPDTSGHTVDYLTSGNKYAIRGLLYQYMNEPDANYPKGLVWLYYAIDGNQNCVRGIKYEINEGTMCLTIVK